MLSVTKVSAAFVSLFSEDFFSINGNLQKVYQLSNSQYSSGYPDMSSVFISVTEKETNYLNKENHPCVDYSHEAFVNCCKTEIWKGVKGALKCIWQPLKTFIPREEVINIANCTDKKSGIEARK